MTKYPDFTDDYRNLSQNIHAPAHLQAKVLDALREGEAQKPQKARKKGRYSRGFSFLQKAAIAALIALLIPVTAFATVKATGGIREWLALRGVKNMEAVETLVNTFPTQPEETISAGQEKYMEFTVLEALCDSQSVFATAEIKPLTDKYLLVPGELGINEPMSCMVMEGYQGDPSMTIEDYAASIGKEIMLASVTMGVEGSPMCLGRWSTVKADGTILQNFSGTNDLGSQTIPVNVTCLYQTLDHSIREQYEYQIELTDNSTRTPVKTFTKFSDTSELNVQMKEMVIEKTELGYTVTATYQALPSATYHVSLLDAQGNFLMGLSSGMPVRDENGIVTVVSSYTDIPSFEGLQFKLIGHDDYHPSDKYGPYQILG